MEDNLQGPVTLPQNKEVNSEMNKEINGEVNGENVVSGLTTVRSQDLLINKPTYSPENKNSSDKQSAIQAVPEQQPG